MRVERLDESAWNHWSNDRGTGGRMGVEYARGLLFPEMGNRFLRVVLLPDCETIHNAFFDRRFTP